MFARLAPFAAALAAGLAASFQFFTRGPELAWPMAVLRAVAAILFVHGLARLVAWAASWLLLLGDQRIDRLGSAAIGAAAVWLVPFAVFWDRMSPLAVLSAAMAAGLFAYVFASHASPGEDREQPSKLMWAIAAAVLLQTAGTAAGLEQWRISSAAVIALFVILAWMLFAAFGPPRNRRTGAFSHCVAAALLVSTAWIRREPGGGGGAITTKVLAAVFSAAEKPAGGSGEATDKDAHQTILLWPEEAETVTLIPPRPVPPVPTPGKAEEQAIPFFGAYWFYRGRVPAQNPTVMHGDPAKQSFRNLGFRSLSMDAVQNFGQRFDGSCCGAIDVAIRSADRHPGTVDIELLLRDTVAAGAPISLGRRRVTSSMEWRIHDNRPPVDETLRFPIEGVARYGRFDEVTVRFHLRQPRSDRSAMIAIRHFAFVR